MSSPTAARSTARRSAAPRTARKRSHSRRSGTAYAMLAPGIVLFALFLAAPIVYTVILSFQKVHVSGLGLGPGSRAIVFAGLANYASVLADPAFGTSVARVLLYGLFLIPTVLILAMLFALLLDSKRARLVRATRLGIFLPYAIPGVVSSLLWGFLYLPGVSPFIQILNGVGIDAPNPLSPGLVTFAIANIGLWGGVGFNMIIIYTSLRAIPTDIYEAARLDGASEIQIALRVKVPLIIPSIIMTALFSIIGVLQVFTEPTTLQPLTNSISNTWSPLMTVYRDAFLNNDIYSAAACSVIIAVATFAFSFGFLRVVQRRAFGQED